MKIDSFRPAGGAQDPGQGGTIVKLGDTLDKLAQRLGVTQDALRQANPQLNLSQLKPGQRIELPAPAPQSVLSSTPDTMLTTDDGISDGIVKVDKDWYAPFVRSKVDRQQQGGVGGPVVLYAGPDDSPPPANLTQFTADKIADKVKDRLTKIPDLKTENYPEISAEEQAAADVAQGVANYKQYLDYAKTAIEIVKISPDGPWKKALLKKLGTRLDSLSTFLDGATAKLGKIGKYAGHAKDAIAISQSARELARDVRNMDFAKPETVERALGSLGKTNDKAQGFLSGIRDYLLTKGTTTAAANGLALAYVGVMITAGIELARAGVKAEREYFDRQKKIIDLIERGGVPEPVQEPQLPPEPTPFRSYAEMREGERQGKRDLIAGTIRNEFKAAREELEDAYYENRKVAHEKFDSEAFPKIYRQHRDAIIRDLAARRGTVKQGGPTFEEAATIGRVLDRMEAHDKGGLTAEEIQNEIAMFRELSPSGRFKAPDRSNSGTVVVGLHENVPFRTAIGQLYTKELDKFYEKNGVGATALEKEYAKAGLTDEARDRMISTKHREFGL